MSNGRILIVEDDEDLVCMLEYNLSRKGYLTLSALNGFAACRLIEEERPDLVLLDIMLPEMDGWEICRNIRSHKRDDICEMPIIMLTALNSNEEKLKGIEMGADDYIPKPFSVKEVLLKVDRLMAREMKKKHLIAVVEDLKARDGHRTDFQDMLFHELRNQLVIIGGYSERITATHFLTPEKYRQCAGVIRESSQLLHSVAEEMLLLSRLESGSFPLAGEELFIEETVRQVISALSRQAQEKRIQIRLERFGDLSVIRLNPTAVRSAISNLVENAIKYSPEGSEVTVRVCSQGGEQMTIDVLDEGPGIPAADRERIFEKFYRGENVKARTKGTGLGLYIAKTLVESMGGSLLSKPRDDKGTSFRIAFRLPSAPLP